MKLKQSLIYITTSLFISIFIIVNIIKAVFNYRFIYGFIDTIILLLFVVSIIALIVKFIKSKIIITALIVLILVFLYLLFIVNGIFRNNIVEHFSSPSGKNTLVVIEGGFIDAVYEAYPVKLGLFYQLQDNGYVENHDDWGGAEVTVTWENDNKAIVKIHSNFTPVEGSNANNEIVVAFD